jgi:hypothetical protein
MRSACLKTCVLALAAALSVPAIAQGTTGTTGGSSAAVGATTAAPDTTVRRDTDRGFDWGWLGLLGLAGLMGLRRQPDVRVDTTRTTGQR